ncbi:MAG: response regulator [Pyrinomonadaceae bacterium]
MEKEDLVQLKALVIDDSGIMRKMVMKSLTETNLAEFEFTEAGSGSEAMEKFDPEVIDIIFADWNMPGMSGIEFARQVRSMSWANHVPIIMVTSESGEGKQQDAFDKARITCYITKPFTVEEMHEKIAPVIEKLESKQQGSAKPAPAPTPPPAKPQGGGFFSKLLN